MCHVTIPRPCFFPYFSLLRSVTSDYDTDSECSQEEDEQTGQAREGGYPGEEGEGEEYEGSDPEEGAGEEDEESEEEEELVEEEAPAILTTVRAGRGRVYASEKLCNQQLHDWATRVIPY